MDIYGSTGPRDRDGHKNWTQIPTKNETGFHEWVNYPLDFFITMNSEIALVKDIDDFIDHHDNQLRLDDFSVVWR